MPRVGLFPELGKLLLDRGFDFHGIVLDRASTLQGAGVRTHESNHLLAIAPTLDVDLGKAARITGGNIHAAVTFNTLRANEPNFVEFVAMSEAAWAKGITVVHSLGGISIDLRGNRAVSQAKMTISQRSRVEGVLCDVTCTGRFYDFLEKRNGKWGIALRQPIYEKDRLDPVAPGAVPVLDKALLKQFPSGYRHLAYFQTRIGYPVKRNMPGLRGPEVEALYEQGAAWLSGGQFDAAAWTALKNT